MEKVLKMGNSWVAGNTQIYPTTAYRVIDTVTGDTERFGKYMNAICFDLQEAIDYIASRTGWEGRLIVESFDCYRPSISNPTAS